MVVNPEGDYLIIIDGYGNHVAADKANRTGIEVFTVPSYTSSASIVSTETATKGEEDHHHTTSGSVLEDHAEAHHDDLELIGDAL